MADAPTTDGSSEIPIDPAQAIASDELEAFLLAKPGTTREMPFSPDSLVFKVAGKMYALLAWQADPMRISFKAEPAENEALRQRFPAIQGAYHMNKRHWSMVDLDGRVPRDLVFDLLDGSYRLVVAKLPKKVQRTLTTDADG
ncbi:MAG: MmcQ/YjbR family DNA-binding protein [Acidobacteriota bacterium]